MASPGLTNPPDPHALTFSNEDNSWLPTPLQRGSRRMGGWPKATPLVKFLPITPSMPPTRRTTCLMTDTISGPKYAESKASDQLTSPRHSLDCCKHPVTIRTVVCPYGQCLKHSPITQPTRWILGHFLLMPGVTPRAPGCRWVTHHPHHPHLPPAWHTPLQATPGCPCS